MTDGIALFRAALAVDPSLIAIVITGQGAPSRQLLMQ